LREHTINGTGSDISDGTGDACVEHGLQIEVLLVDLTGGLVDTGSNTEGLGEDISEGNEAVAIGQVVGTCEGISEEDIGDSGGHGVGLLVVHDKDTDGCSEGGGGLHLDGVAEEEALHDNLAANSTGGGRIGDKAVEEKDRAWRGPDNGSWASDNLSSRDVGELEFSHGDGVGVATGASGLAGSACTRARTEATSARDSTSTRAT